ncbi:DUF4145 domain-containing protein [uncultured Erythrobacter sp.]|uniref:DUF4145 domain-containing protein n=1 Tax=uncultured Erythrobacter sp. TaxID=263913 RepID=UPI00262149A4|nr:DUF4145 domain-containing protein [uncultured Erythrobacter sp.]
MTFQDKEKLPWRVRDLEGEIEGYKEFLREQRIEDDGTMEPYIRKRHTGVPIIGSKFENYSKTLVNVDVSECYNCGEIALWVGEKIVWPAESVAPIPNVDLPPDILADYREAGEIVNSSPRGAAALLRLCLQNLCIHLGEKGKNINDDIASLVSKGLDPRVQKMLDTLRIFGNNAVHPGEIDLRDDRDTAGKLFGLINLVADVMISQPKSVDELYDRIGEGPKKAIEKRDGS